MVINEIFFLNVISHFGRETKKYSDYSTSSSDRRRKRESIDSSDNDSSPNISGNLYSRNQEIEDCDGNQEQLLSGNSVYLNTNLDASFDIQSVKSEAFNTEIHCPLVASTPLNNSITEDDIVFGPKDIDFFGYKVHDFEIGIGCAATATRMTGYLAGCSNTVRFLHNNHRHHETH